MPSVSSSIANGIQGLNRSIQTVIPSQGIPSRGGNGSGLSTWTKLVIHEGGKPRNGRGIAKGFGSGSGTTWILPLPADLNESNTLSWEQQEFGAIEQTLAGGPLAGGGAADNFKSAVASLGAGALKSFDIEIVESVGGALTRTAANPATEILFKASNLRTFQFTWNLIPLTQSDAISIEKFKKEMLKNIYPDASGIGGASRLSYPSEFEVSFHAKGNQGGGEKVIFSTFVSACTEFTVNYGVQGMYGVHEDGSPTQVSISATFQEIYMLVKNDWGE